MQMNKNQSYENLLFVERTNKSIQAYRANLRTIETAKNYRNVESWGRGDTCNLRSGYKEKNKWNKLTLNDKIKQNIIDNKYCQWYNIIS